MEATAYQRTPGDVDRHVRRLAWFALLASIVLLLPTVGLSATPALQLAAALGAVVLIVVVRTLIETVRGYVREQRMQAREAAEASRRSGACMAAEAIQDRVGNLLSLTVGYSEFLVEDERLPADARDRAQRALEGGRAAANAVSTFRQTLDCGARSAETVEQVRAAVSSLQVAARAPRRNETITWTYDSGSRMVSRRDGAAVAHISTDLDPTTASATGHLVAEAPALWQALANAQHLGIVILADTAPRRVIETNVLELLERINTLTSRLEKTAGLEPQIEL
jgi:hypothetical protein